jgi:ketosteroid isomerase-like protein
VGGNVTDKSLIDRELLDLEDRLTKATQNIDIAALDAFYAPDIMFTGVTGAICDKSLVMSEARRGASERSAAASTGGPAVVSYEKDDLRAVRHGDTGICSFRFAVKVRADGKEVTRQYRTTNVWMRRAGTWQVVAAHTATMA